MSAAVRRLRHVGKEYPYEGVRLIPTAIPADEIVGGFCLGEGDPKAKWGVSMLAQLRATRRVGRGS